MLLIGESSPVDPPRVGDRLAQGLCAVVGDELRDNGREHVPIVRGDVEDDPRVTSQAMPVDQLLHEVRLARAELTAGWRDGKKATAMTGPERRRLDRVVLRLSIVEQGLVQHLDENARREHRRCRE
jgi:hypothetical protein